MFKKVLCVFLSLLMIASIFSGCSKKEDTPDEPIRTITDTDPEYYIPDVIDSHVGFGYNVPEVYSLLNRGSFDSDGSYYVSDVGNKIAYGVSKYYVNEIDDYDMLRCEIDKITSSNDIFDNINYKITFLYQNVLSKKMFSNTLLFSSNGIKIFYEVESKIAEKVDGLDCSEFEGLMKVQNDKETKSYPIYGYSIWLKSNPIIFYVIDFNDNTETVSDELKKNIKEMAYSVKIDPYRWAQEQAELAKANKTKNTQVESSTNAK